MPITVQHVFSNTIADGTNTAVVRPSDWNSNHNITYSPDGVELIPAFSNANSISFGTNAGSKITASVAFPAQTYQPAAISAANGSATVSTIPFANSNGVSFSTGTQGIYASVKTDYLTTAAQSNHSHGDPTLNLTNLSGTTASASNGFTISLSAASQSIQTQNSVQIIGSSGNISFANSNGITFGANASTVTASHNGLTTAAQSNHSHGNPTLNLTNLSGTTASNSAGFTLSLSAVGADGYNILAAGTQTAGSAATVNFANANGITFGMSNSNQITASHNGLTTAMLSNASTAFAATGFTTTSVAGVVIVGTHDTNGLKLAVPTFLTTAQPPGAYLTTARASNDGIGLNTALTANGVSWTVNSSGLSLNVPAFLTTAQPVGVYLTTAAQSNHSHGNPTLNLTNLSGTTASNSAGLTISLSAAAPGGGGAINVSAGTTSGNLQTIQFDNANGVSFGLNGSTMTASTAGGYTKTFWYPYNEAVNVVGIHGQGSMVFNPVPLDDALSADRVVFPMYFSNASNSTGTISLSILWGAYTKTDNTLSLYTSISTLVTLAFAGNNSSASQRGIRLLPVSINLNLPQSRYFVGQIIRTSTAGANATISQILCSQLNSNVSGLWDTPNAASVQWPLGVGYLSASTTAIPGSVAFSQIYGTNSLAARPPSWHCILGTI